MTLFRVCASFGCFPAFFSRAAIYFARCYDSFFAFYALFATLLQFFYDTAQVLGNHPNETSVYIKTAVLNNF